METDMSQQKKLALLSASALLMATLAAGSASAQVCKSNVKVLSQPRDGITLLEKYKDEFKALSGASFEIDNLNENDRRAKSRADASTVGKYNVYYVDEANVALFAKSKWIEPLLKHYPKEYDFGDFDSGRQKVATFEGVQWFAPITGGGDMLVYRTDLLEKAGIKPPKTLEEFVAAVKKLHDPANGIYGVALRGQRGSGANVWRWMPYFKGMGGQWFDGNKPSFNSAAGVKATETYLDLFKYSAPGTKTGSWDESTGAFLAGKVAMLIESTPLAGMSIDPKVSSVVGKVAFLPPPAPLTGGGYGHGFAIGSKGNKSEADKQCAGLFVAWATSKKNEERRLAEGQFGELNRSSVIASAEFTKRYGPDLGKALAETSKVTAVNFWQDAQWPDLGDRWGIILEEMITGTRTDVKGGLNELQTFANELVAKRK
jgi:multiple sugar transport system substrate-binding protein